MTFKLSINSIKNRAGVDPRLIEISDLAITLTLVDFGHGPHSGIRTAEEQLELYRKKRSRADGYSRKSRHQSGKALDFFAFVDGEASWQPDHLAAVALAFFQAASVLGYRIKWGGLWEPHTNTKNGIRYGWDMPHVELME